MNNRGPFWKNALKGLDYFLATFPFGIPAGIYISGYVAFKRFDTQGGWRWVQLERFINFLFNDQFHCFRSMKSNSQDIKYYYGVEV